MLSNGVKPYIQLQGVKYTKKQLSMEKSVQLYQLALSIYWSVISQPGLEKHTPKYAV